MKRAACGSRTLGLIVSTKSPLCVMDTTTKYLKDVRSAVTALQRAPQGLSQLSLLIFLRLFSHPLWPKAVNNQRSAGDNQLLEIFSTL